EFAGCGIGGGEGTHFDVHLGSEDGGGGVGLVVEHRRAGEFPGVAKVGVGGGDGTGDGAFEGAVVEAEVVAIGKAQRVGGREGRVVGEGVAGFHSLGGDHAVGD